MSKLQLTVALHAHECTTALVDGRVAIEGCDANFLNLPPEETFHRAFGHHEFDVCELSSSSYLIEHDRGGGAYIALPVFTLRRFRHGAIYVRAGAGIEQPSDLRGKLVGVPEYQVTAVLWARGILADEFGVEPEEVRWRTGGINQPGRVEKLPVSIPGVEIEAMPRFRTGCTKGGSTRSLHRDRSRKAVRSESGACLPTIKRSSGPGSLGPGCTRSCIWWGSAVRLPRPTRGFHLRCTRLSSTHATRCWSVIAPLRPVPMP
jgi:hypothetical protein